MWESRSSAFIDESRRRGKHHCLGVLFARVIVPLKDGKGIVTSNGHDPFIIPAFTNLASNDSISLIIEPKTL
jgi:hypothetical protein